MTNATQQALIAAAVALWSRRRDDIRTVAIEQGLIVTEPDGGQVVKLPGDKPGEGFDLSDAAVIGNALATLQIVGHVVEPKAVVEVMARRPWSGGAQETAGVTEHR